jgi:hypothetical protein
MNRQLKKVPDSFDRDHPAADKAADAGTVDGDGDGQPPDGSPGQESG